MDKKYTPKKAPPPITNALSKAAQIIMAPKVIAAELTDDDVAEITQIFPAWQESETVNGPGENQTLRVYDGVLYKCMSPHTTQSDWTPPVANTLWSRVIPEQSGYPVWQAWDGHNENLHQIGDIVWYPEADTTLYIATAGDNHWTPTEYGWEVYTE